jgi:aminoglycoside phosphotransferase family enzyme
MSARAAEDAQQGVIAFLADPASYGLAGGAVERIDTHCSIVFLAGACAYKLKRAIRYAALDYTTRARRQAACAAELALNRRTAPDLYLGVRSVSRTADGAFAFDGAGPAVDHVVVMRRFGQDDLFDNMADRGLLTPGLMQALGAEVARLHRDAAPTPRHGGADAIRRVVAAHDRELARVAAVLDGVAMNALHDRSLAAVAALAPLLEARRAGGKVRRCHGDLRLANICFFAGRPTLFDCIEFSDEIGCIDVLYDLAFLLMELALRGRNDLGNATFNAYLDRAPETEGLRALPLFLALRAATRAYALAGSAARQPGPRQAQRQAAAARRHIAAAFGFLDPPAPLFIALGGGTDAARQALAAPLAALAVPAPGARRLKSDAPSWSAADSILAAGCAVLVEGAFGASGACRAAAACAARYPHLLLWLGSPPDPAWRVLDPAEPAPVLLAQAARQLETAGLLHPARVTEACP